MKSIFNGTISFGLVNSPIKLFAATEDHDLKPSQVHASDHGKIRYHRICEDCGEQVDFQDIASAYEYEGQTVVLTDAEKPETEKSREITVKEFIPANSVDPIFYESTYYVAPADKKATSYVLLATAMQKAKKIALVEFTLRSTTRMGALMTVKNEAGQLMMVLHSLRWADEVREPDFPILSQRVNVGKAELDMALQYVEKYSRDYDPERYKDVYQERLEEVVATKAKGGNTKQEPGVSDLLAKLAASVKPDTPKGKKPTIRQWCKVHGVQVSARGPIPQDIVDRYEKEVV